jgi:AraC family transcriptional regulator, melibiose operon regulatory protein
MENIYSIYSREALRDDRTASIEAYYLKDWQGYDMPLHRHNCMEIMVVLTGKCVVKTESTSINLKKGEFILLDAAVPHGLTVDGAAPCRIMNLEFSLNKKSAALSLRAAADRYPPLRRFLEEPRPFLVFIDSQDVYGVLRRLINCLDDGGEGQQFAVELLAAELLMAIARLYDEGSSIRHISQVHVRKAMQFMNQNYYRDIGMGDISEAIGIAEGYLSRIFKKSCGITVIDYLTSLRIKKAQMLLGKTELPITDISGYVGVPSRPYFNQLFKKHTSLTPSQYRQASRRETSLMSPGCNPL